VVAVTSLTLRVKPNAGRCGLVEDERGLVVKLDAPPVDGAANERLIRFLAREVFGVPQSDVTIVKGLRGRTKVVRIELPESRVGERIREALKAG
jgi:uncharacterized protein